MEEPAENVIQQSRGTVAQKRGRGKGRGRGRGKGRGRGRGRGRDAQTARNTQAFSSSSDEEDVDVQEIETEDELQIEFNNRVPQLALVPTEEEPNSIMQETLPGIFRMVTQGLNFNVQAHIRETNAFHPIPPFSQDDSDALRRMISSITFVENWMAYCYYGQSPPKTLKFWFQGDDFQTHDTGLEASLPHFASAALPNLNSPSARHSSATSYGKDFLLNVGGSAWTLDWCPTDHSVSANQTSGEYIAVGAHPPGTMHHKLGLPLCGKGVVQIWSICNFDWDKKSKTLKKQKERGKSKMDESCSGCQEQEVYNFSKNADANGVGPCFINATVEAQDANINGTKFHSSGVDEESGHKKQRGRRKLKDKARLKSVNDGAYANYADGYLPEEEYCFPRMLLCLTHEGEVAWDLKWRPLGYPDSPSLHRLGFLAVLLGDGSLQVWEVPVPTVVNYVYMSRNGVTELDPRFIKLEPVFKCSNLKNGDHQSIPLTLEWSNAAPHDLLLAGCHDGTVAMWKFSIKTGGMQDTRPLLCFIADSDAIRTLAWAPNEGDVESKNVIVTGGHAGNIRFWDLREPLKPVWDLHLTRGIVLSLDWLNQPKCIVVTMDDGTLRTLSLANAAVDTPVTGRTYSGTQFQGLQGLDCCPSFSVSYIQSSKCTGLMAYSSVEGSTFYFQLTQKAVEKDRRRYQTPHYLCGYIIEENASFKIISPTGMVSLPTKKMETSQTSRVFTSDIAEPFKCKPKNRAKNKSSLNHSEPEGLENENVLALMESATASQKTDGDTEPENFPSKQSIINKVRWNLNKGSEKWLCYASASGIVRCQEIKLDI